MSGQIQEVIKKKTLSDKVHLMSDALRNCTEKQCSGKFYDPRNNSLCAYGALGFMSGIPKDELKSDFTRVLGNYGMDLDESMKTIELPEDVNYPVRKATLFSAIYVLNDKGYSFNEVADQLDKWADNL
jgi:antitoxin component of RelBE/YafQ-DinJ toxin-antitoxin module